MRKGSTEYLMKILSEIYGREILRPILPIFLLIIIGSIMVPEKFLTLTNVKILLMQLTPLAAIATGEMLVILTGGVDLSPGSAQGFTAMLAALIYILTKNFSLAVLAALAMGLVIGAINGVLVTKLKIFSFVATLAGLAIWRAVDLFISGGKLIYGLTPWDIFTYSIADVIPLGFLVIVIVEIAVYIMLQYSILGRYIYAMGSNEEALRLSGVRADLVKFMVFTIAGLMYGLGGVLIIGMSGLAVDPWTARGNELSAIASCVLGGILLTGGEGHPLGAFFGAALLTLISNILILLGYTEYYIQQIITGVILIGAATALSRGLRYVK
ncbi:ABC transporter permease [Thermogladius sp. KZ2Tp1]|uniref:ABC transporter permease n=1 Tax=Thermogladius sp. KZ2Tp1 TaxID=3136289 RepID=UPI003DA87B09